MAPIHRALCLMQEILYAGRCIPSSACLFSSGIRPLRRDISQIKNTLYKSYPLKFANTHESASIDIHYVNCKSLSKYALKKLKEDMKELKISSKLPNFKDAILITLSFRQSYQRWIVLKNGKSFLWHYTGDTVLDLDIKKLNVGELYTFGQSYKIINTDGKIEE